MARYNFYIVLYCIVFPVVDVSVKFLYLAGCRTA